MREESPLVTTTIFENIEPTLHYGRRRHVRYMADRAVLFIAPTHRYGEVPCPNSFFPVRCKDLSRGGFSFFLSEPPDFAILVVQLGTEQRPIYMEAEVVHFSKTERKLSKSAWDLHGREYDSRFDSTAIQIGCQFIKRVAVSAG